MTSLSTAASVDCEILHVIYPRQNDTRSHCSFFAIASCKIEVGKNRENDKCIFSQEKLIDCASLSAIVYSENAEVNEWRYLCNFSSTWSDEIHIFDSEYLKEWLNIKGCEYIQCPLCKSGVSEEEKEHIEEHAIESMEQLKEKLLECKKNSDEPMMNFYELLIFEKACSENWNARENPSRIRFNCDMLKEVFSHWTQKKKMESLRNRILNTAKIAIKNDNHKISKIILKNLLFDKSNVSPIARVELADMLNYACETNSYACVELILRYSQNIEFEKRPICLLNAIKFTQNVELINKVISGLLSTKSIYVCDDVFALLIKKDFVEISKRIVELRWHKPTQDNEKLAETLDGLVWNWLRQRKMAAQTLADMHEDNQGLGWDDWDEDVDEDGDDDWANDNNDDDHNINVQKLNIEETEDEPMSEN